MSYTKERYRVTFVCPAGAGSYAPERITFGATAANVSQDGFTGVTALIETVGAATGAILELWLPKVNPDSTTPLADSDYSNSGLSITSGAETWAFASYPGAQLRVKSAGVAGSVVVSASGD